MTERLDSKLGMGEGMDFRLKMVEEVASKQILLEGGLLHAVIKFSKVKNIKSTFIS